MKEKKIKKVFVSGCCDMLHSGHVAFFEEAAGYGDLCVDEYWHAMLSKWEQAFTACFDAQIAMFPNMASPEILNVLDGYKPDVLGWKVSGAGAGGCLVFVSEQPVSRAIRIRIRRF